jgi:Leucine-rich repeat (LRR) protein
MNVTEDRRGIGLFLVPALMGWAQIVIMLVGHLLFGDAGTLVGFGTMVVFLIVMAVLVHRDARELGIDAGAFVAGVLLLFLFAYPMYMAVRRRRGAALGGIAGMLAMALFFLPLLVLPLGAKIVSNKLAAHTPPAPSVTAPTPQSSAKTAATKPHQNQCAGSTCTIYTLDEAAKAMLSAPENASKIVVLSDPDTAELTWLATLPSLTQLRLDDATHLEDLTPLSKLVGLESLDIWNSKIKTLAPIADLTRLETLKIENAYSLADIGAVSSMPNLKELHFNAPKVTDFTPIGAASHLRTLHILSSNAPLDPLSKLTSLQQLDIDPKSGVSVAPLGALAGLRTLNLWESSVSDPSPLAKLVGLETLNASSAHMTTIAFASSMRQLKTIDLDGNAGLSDLTPLRGLPSLTDVEASGTAVEDVLPLASCPKLQRLSLDKTKVKTLAPLAMAKALTTISLSGSTVTDLLPLAKLPLLKTVTIKEGQIPDAAMNAFKTAAPSVRVVVSKS